MKKRIAFAAAGALALGWTARVYALNDTLAVHDPVQTQWFGMNESVSLDDCKCYGGEDQSGYAIAVDACRIVDAADYLAELGRSPEEFEMLPERYLELTLDIENHGSDAPGINFFSLPVMSGSWYTFFDANATAYANPFFEGQYEAYGVAVEEQTNAAVKVVYRLYEFQFPEKQWEHLEDENMELWLTVEPVFKKIQLQF